MMYMAIFVLLDGLLLLALTVPLLPHWVAYFLLALSILVIVSGCLIMELIRTICPLVIIGLQVLILIKIGV